MYVRCTRTRAAYGWYARDVKTRADSSVIPSNSSRFKSCFAICSEHKYSEYFQNATKTTYDAGENGLDVWQRQLSAGREIGLGALPRLNLNEPWVLFVVHAYIANMQYIVRSCYAGLCNTNHYTTRSRSPHNMAFSQANLNCCLNLRQ